MTTTVYGPLADDLGHTEWVDTIAHRGPGNCLVAEERHRYAVLKADQFRHRQPAVITVDAGTHHGGGAGQVIYLERSGRYLQAVAVLALEAQDLDQFGPSRFSTVTLHPRDDDVELRSVAIVKASAAATIGLPTLQWIPGDIRNGALRHLGLGQTPAILKRARDWELEHRRSGATIVAQPEMMNSIEYLRAPNGLGRLALRDGELIGLVRPAYDYDRRPPGPLRVARSRGRVLRVR